MCSNKKILPVWDMNDNKPGMLILDEFQRARHEVLHDPASKVREYPRPGLTMKTHWALIRHRVETEYNANQQ